MTERKRCRGEWEGEDDDDETNMTFFSAKPTEEYNLVAQAAHYQLQDNLLCSSDSSDLYIKQRHKVVRYNLLTGKNEDVLDVTTDVAQNESRVLTCFLLVERYLVVGGPGPCIHVIDRLQGHTSLFSGSIAGRMCNSLSAHRYKDELRLIVSNNDGRNAIQAFKLPDMQLLYSTSVYASYYGRGCAVNASVVSPDGKWMIAIGDKAMFWVFDVSDGHYSLTHIVPTISDKHEFGTRDGLNMVSWDSSSSFFAIAAEAGCCLLYSRPTEDSRLPLLLRTFWSVGVLPSIVKRLVNTAHIPDESMVFSTPTTKETTASSNDAEEEEIGEWRDVFRMVFARFVEVEAEDEMQQQQKKTLLICGQSKGQIHVIELFSSLSSSSSSSSSASSAVASSMEHPYGKISRQVIQLPLRLNSLCGLCFSPEGDLFVSATRAHYSRGILRFSKMGVKPLYRMAIETIRQHIHKFKGIDWFAHLPQALAEDIWSPFGGIPQPELEQFYNADEEVKRKIKQEDEKEKEGEETSSEEEEEDHGVWFEFDNDEEVDDEEVDDEEVEDGEEQEVDDDDTEEEQEEVDEEAEEEEEEEYDGEDQGTPL